MYVVMHITNKVKTYPSTRYSGYTSSAKNIYDNITSKPKFPNKDKIFAHIYFVNFIHRYYNKKI